MVKELQSNNLKIWPYIILLMMDLEPLKDGLRSSKKGII
jgi:hypothetical protein